MAPLLGRKPYPLAKPLAEPPGPGEEVYIIEHTKEAFRNKEEYEARLQRYDERIWTCKSTGSLQLTHKEAWEEEQEVTELLQEEYPLWFEKPVLEMVHHNTVSLDKLVEMAWVEILTKYAVGEECDFLVGKDQSLRVKVIKIHPLETPEGESGEKKLEGACDSPSSDKENASQENQRKEPPSREEENRRESLSDRARRSPRKATTAMKEEKKRWVMPKFLPHKYDVKLINEDKVISDVPADSLYRTERPPTKEIMRYFIRHYALRLGKGESAPWVVEDDLVKKYNLPSKFSDFLLDPQKFLAGNPSTKRKSLTSPEGKPSKKVKTGDTPGEDSGNEKGEKKKKKKKEGLPLSPTIWGHMQKMKMNGSPLKVKNSGTPKKGDGKGSAPSTPKSGKKTGDKKDGKKSGKGGDKKLDVLKSSKKDGKTGDKTPKMKQMTLLQLAKGTAAGSPKKRARSSSLGTPKLGKPLHPMALHLVRYYKEHKGKEDKKTSLSSLITKAAKTLSADDRGRLPDELKELVQKRWELLEQKKRWAAMSEEEKNEEMKRRRAELKEKLREKAKEKRKQEMLVRQEQSRRYEDQEIEGGKALPTFKLVDMPEGLPNTLFGSVAMVVDFLHCYAGLLMPEDQYPITAVALMEALAGERSGFHYLNRVLVVLLQTLLQDELAEGYSELDMSLSEIPLTMHSASELTRLCLRPCDAHDESAQGSEDSGAVGGYDDVVSSEFLEKLETVEVFELSPEEKVDLLVALCHRILMTYSVEDHVDAMQQRSAELWKERLAMLKEVNDRKKAEKKMKKEMESKGEKKKDGPAKKESKKEVKVEPEPEPEDLISLVKSRRLMAMQAKKEKEELDRQNKERMEKEAEEERLRKQKAAAERAFQDGITKARLVMRRAPLGTDRNHNRYWLFSDVVPGLYVEKGWVHDGIDYSFTPPPEEKAAEPEMEEEEEEGSEAASVPDSQGREAEKDDASVDGAASEGVQQGAAPDVCIETTIPKQGQNLWFVIDSPAELEELVESLHPQGVRESELKLKIQSRYQDILHSIHLSRKSKLGLRSCDGYAELLKYMRSDIQEIASRLQKGGLGYLDDNVDIEEQLKDTESLKDFGECIITLQACVIKKFLQGFMAPKQKKKKKQAGEESSKAEEVDEEKKLAEEARVATAVEKWKSAIREALTFSRMHVLLGMLDACIKWDMSAENARCKVCRRKELRKDMPLRLMECRTRPRQGGSRKLRAEQGRCVRQVYVESRQLRTPSGDDEKLILCDECNKAFHLFCLRPALYRIPAGEWLCPACQPTVARRGSRSRNYKQDTDEEESEEESDEECSEDDDEDEEENDYKAMGHSLRPRKKNKQSSARQKISKSKAKKASSRQSSKQRAGPSSPADIDELVRQSTQTGVSKQALELERCEEILKKLMKFRYSWPFREPVSLDEAEDYLDIISEPMDFQTMLGKFGQGSYRHAQDFLEDMKLVFSNAEEYNQQGSTVLSCMGKTEQTLTELIQKLLPGTSYLRRRSRKRVNQAPPSSEEEEEEEDEEEEGDDDEGDCEEQEEEPKKKMQNGKSNRKTGRNIRGRKAESESEADSEEEEESSRRRRKSKRTSGASGRKDYRELDSDGEQGTRRTRLRGGRGDASSDEEQPSHQQRHSKRLKRS
ncbi:PREDICTED: tyrosine-protein kinase BAZ1B isoform X1 [Poecilia mexicana]|uniref:tyrosine-protein kinase BAZ1B isoform X1 n=1 Tax=Poecilia mexicana TaxID=48701 RepID=UPI00072EE806|nr:PREDICTED: tyrosine-protein kinase BAZ1B isoform X1 [Poecilia mexicana]